MEIHVELFLNFRRFAPTGAQDTPFVLRVPDASTVDQVLSLLGLPAGAAKIVLVDGRVRPGETLLRAGQTITVFPPLDGG